MLSAPADPISGAIGDYAEVALSCLRAGATLRAPIYEDRADGRVLLLASGMRITETLLKKLHGRGSTQVLVHRRELARLTGPGAASQVSAAGKHDPAISEERDAHQRWSPSAGSLIHDVRLHGTNTYRREERRRFVKIFQGSVRQLDAMFEQIEAGDARDVSQLSTMCSESLANIVHDLDLFVAMGLEPATDKYPCKHSLQSAMLAMSIGTILGLRAEHLIELGIGCLLHDAGMLRIDEKVVNSIRPLSRVEFLEITKHPLLTYDMMQQLRDMPNGSRMVAYQMHERLNGTGYPRQRTANQIHPLAKIAAVADVFVALVSPRPHRPGLMPYHAMERIIQGTHQGLYDAEVARALLHTVSLFPIGSYVEASDGRVGRVLRSNRDLYTRPVVELSRPGVPGEAAVIDLSKEPGLSIVRPLESLAPAAPAGDDHLADDDRLADEIAAADFWE
ncbi:MAG: HD domain-containing phosphohydrolase [Planctomycetaceae bacterium]